MNAKAYTRENPALAMDYPSFVFRTLQKEGYEAEALLAGTGLTGEQLTDPNFRTGFSSPRRLFLNAIEQSGDPHLGIRVAQQFEATYVGLPAYAAMNAACFRDALDVLVRFFFLTFPAFDFTVSEVEHGEAALSLRLKFQPEDIAYFVCSSALIVCNGVLKAVLGAPQGASCGEMTVSEPAGWSEVSDQIGFPIRFEALDNRLIFQAELLDKPLPGADPLNHPRLVTLCEKTAMDAERVTTLTSQVLSFLEQGRNLGAPVSKAAEALGYSERGLRRHLERSGTSYRKLTDQIRESRARDMLTNTTRPIQAIAYELGYDTPSNFARSFKRWTGATPKAFREGQKPRGDDGRN